MEDPIQQVNFLQMKIKRQKGTKIEMDIIKGELIHNFKDSNFQILSEMPAQPKNLNEKKDANDEEYKEDKNYFSFIFDAKFTEMIDSYLKNNKDRRIRKNYDQRIFKKKFYEVVRNMRMNDIDFASFSLLLDKLDWNNKEIDFWEFLYFVGFSSKKITSDKEHMIILKNLSRKEYYDWIKDRLEKEKINIYDYLTTNKIIQRNLDLSEANSKYVQEKGSLDLNRMVEYMNNLDKKRKNQKDKNLKRKKQEKENELNKESSQEKKEIVINENQDEKKKLMNDSKVGIEIINDNENYDFFEEISKIIQDKDFEDLYNKSQTDGLFFNFDEDSY